MTRPRPDLPQRIAQAVAGLEAVTGLKGSNPAWLDPHGYYVYVLWFDDGRIPMRPIYIGQSENILARLGDHMRNTEKRNLTSRVTLLRCNSKPQMDETELRLIRHYRPQLNVTGNPDASRRPREAA